MNKKSKIKHISTSKIFFESLKCILTSEEKQKLGSDMAEAVAKKTEAEKAKKSFLAQITSDIAKEEATISICSEKIRSGYEFRRIECKEVKDFENDKVISYRNDTGDKIRERQMEPEERQKQLNLEKAEQLEKEQKNGDNGKEPGQTEAMQEV